MAFGADEAAAHDLSLHAQFPAEQVGLFRKVLLALARAQTPFTVAGAFAFQRYTGIWRATKDLDLFLPGESVLQALQVCREEGLVTEVRDPVWLAKAWSGEYYVDFISGMSNGAIWVTEDWVRRARPAVILGVETRLLAPEHLLISKLFVLRRDRFDGSDIAHLIFRSGSVLDWDEILSASQAYWQILLGHLLLYQYIYPNAREQVPQRVWRSLLERLQAALQDTAEVQPAFRGMLVDEAVFDADVEMWGLEDVQAQLRAERLRQLPQGGKAA
jgi:hypothetical protein